MTKFRYQMHKSAMPSHAHPRTTAENVKLTEQALRLFFFSFFELSFTVKVLVPNVGLSQASTDSFHVVSNSGIYQRHPDARSLAV